MAGRSRQSILASEEKTEHAKVEGEKINRSIKNKENRDSKIIATLYVLNGDKIIKREKTGGGTVYSTFLGRKNVDKQLYANLKEKGML